MLTAVAAMMTDTASAPPMVIIAFAWDASVSVRSLPNTVTVAC